MPSFGGMICSDCCGPCTVAITVYQCGGVTPIAGATVTIKAGGTTYDTQTTDALGACTVTIPSTGSYTIQTDWTDVTGSRTGSQTQTLQCGVSATVIVPLANTNNCCDSFCGDLPDGTTHSRILHLTDSCLKFGVFASVTIIQMTCGTLGWHASGFCQPTGCLGCGTGGSIDYYFSGDSLRCDWGGFPIKTDGTCQPGGTFSSGSIIYTLVSRQCSPYQRTYTCGSTAINQANYPLYCGCTPTVTITF